MSAVSKPTGFKNNFVTIVAVCTGGFDTPFGKNAQGYSTTDFLNGAVNNFV